MPFGRRMFYGDIRRPFLFFEVNMDSDTISVAAGVLISLGASFIPGLKDRFQALEPTQQRLVMLLLMCIVGVGVFAVSCAGLVSVVSCTRDGAVLIVRAFVLAAVANQTTYSIVPQPAGGTH